jgi:putative SOS response-associated peptidase YedK
MCGRFTVTTKDTKSVADRFQVELERSLERNSAGEAPAPSKERAKQAAKGMGRFNVAPTQEVLTIRSSPDPDEAAEGLREARMMRWGLVPRWAKDLKVGYRMINAKTENLTKSRAYSPLVGKFRHRCLIVADGFYEWMKAEDPKQPRQPWRFTVDGGEPFAFAGLCTRKEWDEEEDAERGRLQGPRPDAGDPAQPRGRGRLAATRPRGRGRAGDAGATRREADGGRPRQPEAEQGRQRVRRARAARRP